MPTLLWIIATSLLMSLIALVGSVTFFLKESTQRRVIPPLIALAAGTLLGGAFLHMIPVALECQSSPLTTLCWVLAGFTAFFALEQFLHWHHCQRAASDCRRPVGTMILVGDGLHNFLGGLAVAGTFLIDIRLGLTTWLAAAAHEIPQELGDFGVLVYSGWSKRRALTFNVLSALTFLVGGLVAYVVSSRLDVSFLVPLAAGNFIYIGASDLVPEIHKHSKTGTNAVGFVAFVTGVFLMILLKILTTT